MFTFLRGIESPLERCGLQRRTPDATKAHHLLRELLPRSRSSIHYVEALGRGLWSLTNFRAITRQLLPTPPRSSQSPRVTRSKQQLDTGLKSWIWLVERESGGRSFIWVDPLSKWLDHSQEIEEFVMGSSKGVWESSWYEKTLIYISKGGQGNWSMKSAPSLNMEARCSWHKSVGYDWPWAWTGRGPNPPLRAQATEKEKKGQQSWTVWPALGQVIPAQPTVSCWDELGCATTSPVMTGPWPGYTGQVCSSRAEGKWEGTCSYRPKARYDWPDLLFGEEKDQEKLIFKGNYRREILEIKGKLWWRKSKSDLNQVQIKTQIPS
jgi:hypothetical protein